MKKIELEPELVKRALHGLNEMIAWYNVKIEALQPPTEDDELTDVIRKLIELSLTLRYSEVLVVAHNLILALAHNDGLIDLEKENKDEHDS